jgi:uncharacterized transporter YbjL
MKLPMMIFKKLFYPLTIILVTLLTCSADLFQKGQVGFFGFSSLRVTIHQIAFLLFGLLASMRLFHVEKNKDYRLVYLIPMTIFTYNIGVNILDCRKTDFNTFGIKFSLSMLLVVVLIVRFLISKTKNA